MQARRVARELALLALSQLPHSPQKLSGQSLQDLIVAAVRALTAEAHEVLLTAAADLKQGHERLHTSETRAKTPEEVRSLVDAAMQQTETAINRLGTALELPETIQLASHDEVRKLALDLVKTVYGHLAEIDALLSRSLVDWQLDRLSRVDRDILRLATAEMAFLRQKENVAITEAVELAKRYSGEDSHKFINGVLRRVTQQMHQAGAV